MQRYNTLTPSIKKFELTGKAHQTVSWNMSRRNNEKLLIKWGGGGGGGCVWKGVEDVWVWIRDSMKIVITVLVPINVLYVHHIVWLYIWSCCLFSECISINYIYPVWILLTVLTLPVHYYTLLNCESFILVDTVVFCLFIIYVWHPQLHGKTFVFMMERQGLLDSLCYIRKPNCPFHSHEVFWHHQILWMAFGIITTESLQYWGTHW